MNVFIINIIILTSVETLNDSSRLIHVGHIFLNTSIYYNLRRILSNNSNELK